MSLSYKTASERGALGGIVLTALTAVSLLTIGCGPTKKPVCPDVAEHIVVVPFTSFSDLATSKEITPSVAAQAVERAVNSCGRLIVGLQNNKSEADLELFTASFTPKHTEAFNRKPVIRPLLKQGERFVKEKLVTPLNAMPPTKGSPFFNSLAKISEELKIHGESRVLVALVGDGVAIEESPQRLLIDLRKRVPPTEAELAPFVPLLANLKGSCVVLLGAGAKSILPDQVLRNGRTALRDTLKKAGAQFVATRSRTLPKDCSGATS